MATASHLHLPLDAIASPGLTGVSTTVALLGSVATRVVEQAPCDVLVVA